LSSIHPSSSFKSESTFFRVSQVTSLPSKPLKMAKDSIWNNIDSMGKWKHTRFDPRALEAAGSNYLRADPWARNEAWRSQGVFTKYNRLVKGSAPGLGIATVAFVGYCVYEALFMKDSDHGEGGH